MVGRGNPLIPTSHLFQQNINAPLYLNPPPFPSQPLYLRRWADFLQEVGRFEIAVALLVLFSLLMNAPAQKQGGAFVAPNAPPCFGLIGCLLPRGCERPPCPTPYGHPIVWVSIVPFVAWRGSASPLAETNDDSPHEKVKPKNCNSTLHYSCRN
jgi:hypothetical protein